MWLAENTGRKKSSKNRHLGTIAQLCRAMSSQLRHISTIGKKLVKQQYLLQMSPQYGKLRPTSGWDQSGSLGHPCKFQRVSHLGILHGTLIVGVSQTLRRWTEGITYIRQGVHRVGHWPTFLVRIFYTYVLIVSSYSSFKLQESALTHTQEQPFYGPLSGTTRMSRYQKKHSPTHHPDHHPIFISFFHLPRSLYKLHVLH